MAITLWLAQIYPLVGLHVGLCLGLFHQEPSQNLPKYAHISHTQTREIPCFKCFGNDHLASHCSNERSMILRDKDNNSSQDKETSGSEENMKIENNQQVKVELSIGTYKDKVLCDAVPKETCHVLLRRPLQSIQNFMLHGRTKRLPSHTKKKFFMKENSWVNLELIKL